MVIYRRNTRSPKETLTRWCIDKRDKNKMAAAGMRTLTRDPRLSEKDFPFTTLISRGHPIQFYSN